MPVNARSRSTRSASSAPPQGAKAAVPLPTSSKFEETRTGSFALRGAGATSPLAGVAVIVMSRGTSSGVRGAFGRGAQAQGRVHELRRDALRQPGRGERERARRAVQPRDRDRDVGEAALRHGDLARPHAQRQVGERVVGIGEGEVVEAVLARRSRRCRPIRTAKRAMSAAALVTLTSVVKVVVSARACRWRRPSRRPGRRCSCAVTRRADGLEQAGVELHRLAPSASAGRWCSRSAARSRPGASRSHRSAPMLATTLSPTAFRYGR